MAIKYVDVSATFNGDGTLSTPAASDGAPGAWNNLLAAFDKTPAYGSVDDGDIIHIRSGDGNGNFTVNDTGITGVGGSSVSTNKITWVVDNGVVWPHLGYLTISGPNATTGRIEFASYCHFIGNNIFQYLGNHTGTSATPHSGGASYISGIALTTSTAGTNGSYRVVSNGTIWEDCLFAFKRYTHGTIIALMQMSNFGTQTFINCVFDFSGAGSSSNPIFDIMSTYGGFTRVMGGKVIPNGVTQPLIANGGFNNSYGGGYQITGLDFPKEMLPDPAAQTAAGTRRFLSTAVICNPPSRPYDFMQLCGNGAVDFIQDQNFPYLNAVLPDGSNTGWSFRVTPHTSITAASPIPLPLLQKYYSLASGIKKLTIEFLVNNNFAVPERGDLSVAIAYTNAAGEQKMCRQTLAVPSSAGWSATIYGAQSYTRYKLEVTTEDAIKQNSMITAQVCVGCTRVEVGDFMFVDPDIGVAAV